MTRLLRDAGDLGAALGLQFSDEQLAAITAPLAPGVIIAGAGSGKTTVMAARVVWLVGTGQATPEQVLGLTFTRKAAAELSSRIRGALERAAVIDSSGIDEAGEQLVLTYDAFAARLVGEHGLRIGVESDPLMITGASRFRLASRVVADAAGPFEHLSRLRPDSITQRLLELDAQLTAHLVTRDDLERQTREFLLALEQAPRNRLRAVYASLRTARAAAEERLELAALAEEYAALKRRLGYVEFADQMAVAARLVQAAPEVAAMLRQRFAVVLLDEYQDTSSAQAALLRGLFSGPDPARGRGHPVTAVGDPFQAIYGWRGAAASNILAFAAEFPEASGRPAARYALTVNRRSGPAILAAANDLARNLRADPAMEFDGNQWQLVAPPGTPDGTVATASFDTWPDEVGWIADRIVAAHAAGEVPRWSDIAVLTRRNAHIGPLYGALVERDVPVEIVGLGGLLNLPEIVDVTSTLALLDDVTANPAVIRLLNGPRWAIGLSDLVLLGRRAVQLAGAADEPGAGLAADLDRALARTDATVAVSLLEAAEHPGDLPYTPEARARFARFAAEFRALRAHSAEPVLDLVRRVIASLGLEIELTSNAGSPSQLGAFVDAVAGYVDVDGDASLTGLLAYLEAEADHGVGLEQAVVSAADSVKLLTVHKAKGLEWELVFLPGLAADVFPSMRVTSNWLKAAAAVPADLRGDADAIPQLADVTDGAATEYAQALTREAQFAEDRLVYVAATRARRHLVATTHTWAPTLIKPRAPSAYFTTLSGHGTTLATASPPAPENPLAGSAGSMSWPAAGDVEARARRIAAATAVAEAMDALGRGEKPDDTTETIDDAARVARWDSALAQLLAAAEPAATTPAPTYLSATGLVRAAREPAAFAAELARPMPRLSGRSQLQGSRFHRWLERRFSLTPQLDASWEPDDDAEDADFAKLSAAFERGRFATRRPRAVEVPFSMVLGGVLVRGRIDAVFDDGPETLVVDWKTGPARRADPLQLAIYKVAWAELQGLPLDAVRAGFFDVLADELVLPDELPDREGLVRLLRSSGLGA